MYKIVVLFISLFSALLHADDKIYIQGTFLENENNSLVLLEKFEIGTKIIASTNIDNGVFKLELPGNTEPGVYRLKYNQKEPNAFFDILINGKEHFIEFIFNCKEINAIPNFKVNSENYSYYNYLKLLNNALQALTIKQHFIKNYPNIFEKEYQKVAKSYKKDIIRINQERLIFLKKNKNFFWSTHLILNQPIYITADELKDQKTIETEKYEKYWDCIDTSNSKLLNTPLYSDHILVYLQYYLNSNIELSIEEKEIGIKKSIDSILARFSSNEATQKFAVLFLVKGFQEIGMHQIVAYIDTKYETLLLKYANPKELETHQSRIESYEKLKAGTLAPNIEWKEVNTTEKSGLHQIKAKEIVLVFWSSDCPYCEETMKKSDNWAINNPDKVVVAIGIETDRENYFETIKQYKNILFYTDFKGFNSIPVKEYAILATPTIYLIDENKLIKKSFDYFPY